MDHTFRVSEGHGVCDRETVGHKPQALGKP